jgi:hypothetical protein
MSLFGKKHVKTRNYSGPSRRASDVVNLGQVIMSTLLALCLLCLSAIGYIGKEGFEFAKEQATLIWAQIDKSNENIADILADFNSHKADNRADFSALSNTLQLCADTRVINVERLNSIEVDVNNLESRVESNEKRLDSILE